MQKTDDFVFAMLRRVPATATANEVGVTSVGKTARPPEVLLNATSTVDAACDNANFNQGRLAYLHRMIFMSMLTRKFCLIALSLTCLFLGESHASGESIRMWFSLSRTDPYQFNQFGTSPASPTTAEVDLVTNKSMSLYLWGHPKAGRRLAVLSLNLFAGLLEETAPTLTAQAQRFAFYNPTSPHTGDERFGFLLDSDRPSQTLLTNEIISPTPYTLPLLPHEAGVSQLAAGPYTGGIYGLQAFNIDSFTSFEGGVGDSCEQDTCVEGPQGSVWRIGQLDITATATTGITEFRLEPGGPGILETELVDDSVEPALNSQVVFGEDTTSYAARSPEYQRLPFERTPSHTVPTGDLPEIIVRVVEPVVGDYNFDTVVNAADYTVWRSSLGKTGAGLPADGNGNLMVDQGDYLIWRQHYGASAGTAGAGSGGAIGVPEPGSVAAILIAFACLTTRLRRLGNGVMCGVLVAVANATLVHSLPAATDWVRMSDGNWGASNNWSNGLPSITSSANFPASLGFNLDINLNNSREANGLRQRNVGQTRITPGNNPSNSLTLAQQGVIVFESAGRLLIDSDVLLASSMSWEVRRASGGDDLFLENGADPGIPLLDLASHVLTINGPGNTRIRTNVVGAGSIEKRGNGTLTLQGNNTFSNPSPP